MSASSHMFSIFSRGGTQWVIITHWVPPGGGLFIVSARTNKRHHHHGNTATRHRSVTNGISIRDNPRELALTFFIELSGREEIG
jgi:hypothetical protein